MAGGYNIICLPGLKLIEEKVFTTSGTYNVPPNARLIQFFIVSGGAGGGGGGGGLAGGYGGGGGGGGGAGGAVMGYVYITGTLTSINVGVGSGGSGGAGGAPGSPGGGGGNGGRSSIRVDGMDIVTRFGTPGGGGGAGTSTSGGYGGGGGIGGGDYARSRDTFVVPYFPPGRTANTWIWLSTRSPIGAPITPDNGEAGASGTADSGGRGGNGGWLRADYSPIGWTTITLYGKRSLGGRGGDGGVGADGANAGVPEGYGGGGGGGGGGAPGYSGGNGSNGGSGIVIIRAYALNKDIIPGMDFVGVV